MEDFNNINKTNTNIYYKANLNQKKLSDKSLPQTQFPGLNQSTAGISSAVNIAGT